MKLVVPLLLVGLLMPLAYGQEVRRIGSLDQLLSYDPQRFARDERLTLVVHDTNRWVLPRIVQWQATNNAATNENCVFMTVLGTNYGRWVFEDCLDVDEMPAVAGWTGTNAGPLLQIRLVRGFWITNGELSALTVSVNGTNLVEVPLTNSPSVMWDWDGSALRAHVASTGVTLEEVLDYLSTQLIGQAPIEVAYDDGADELYVRLLVEAGSGINLSTNMGVLTITATGGGGGTNTWKIEVNGAEVVEPDLLNSAQISMSVGGSSVTFGIVAGSITSTEIQDGSIQFADLLSATAGQTFIGRESGAGSFAEMAFDTNYFRIDSGVLKWMGPTNLFLPTILEVDLLTATNFVPLNADPLKLLATAADGTVESADVSSDLEYAAKLLSITNTVGSGRLVRESALSGDSWALRSAVAITNSEADGEVQHGSWTIPAGMLADDGDELDIHIGGFFLPYGDGANAYKWVLTWEDDSPAEEILRVNLPSEQFALTSSRSAVEWRIRIMRVSSNTYSAFAFHAAGPLDAANPGSPTNIVSVTVGHDVAEITGMSFDDDDVTFGLWTEIDNAARAAFLWTRGYVVRKL